MAVADVAERARLQDGDRLGLVYEPDELDEVLDDDNAISSTDTAAIVREKRP